MEDAHFMSAKDKELVVKQFEKFLESGYVWEKFTDKLYQHLIMHCSFIAHYNRQGFFNTYFNGDKKDFERFCSNFVDKDEYTGESTPVSDGAWCHDMRDINTAMSNILLKYYKILIDKFSTGTKDTAILQIRVLMSENDISINELR